MNKTLAIIAIVVVVIGVGAGAYFLIAAPGGDVSYNYEESDDVPTMLPAPAAGKEYLIVDVVVRNDSYRDGDDGYEVDPENFGSLIGSDGRTYWFNENLTDRYNSQSGKGYPDELGKGKSAYFSVVFIVDAGVTLGSIDITDHDNDRVSYDRDTSLAV